MKLKIKDVARHLVQNEDVNMPVFMKRQLAQQLVRSSKRLPGTLKNWMSNKVFPSAEEVLEQDSAPSNCIANSGIKEKLTTLHQETKRDFQLVVAIPDYNSMSGA